jgi:cytochrome c oxidase assembly protein subunit 15
LSSATARDFRIAARLGAATTLTMFGLIVIGSVVRTTGSGLACPDWPLCQGRLIPAFDPQVMIEWTHRAVALVVSVLLFACVLWTIARRELRARLGKLAALAVALLLTQVLLGALTVWKLLHPSVVNTHLAVALLLFATLLAWTASAEAAAAPVEDWEGAPPRHPLLLPGMALATTLVYAQAVLGGAVAAQHAGLACPDWPACNGEWFPPLGTLAGLQMAHRTLGYVVVAAMIGVALMARGAADAGVRSGARLALWLTCAQVVLGVCNVLLGTPVWITALHLATAATMLGMMVLVTFRVALIPSRERRLVTSPAS